MKNLSFLGLLDSLSQDGIQYGFGHEYNYWLKSDETTIDVDRVRSEVFADLSAMMLLHPEDVAETRWLFKELYDFFEEVCSYAIYGYA